MKTLYLLHHSGHCLKLAIRVAAATSSETSVNLFSNVVKIFSASGFNFLV